MYNPSGEVFGILATVNECLAEISQVCVRDSNAETEGRLKDLNVDLGDAVKDLIDTDVSTGTRALVAKALACRRYCQETECDPDGQISGKPSLGVRLMWSVIEDLTRSV